MRDWHLSAFAIDELLAGTLDAEQAALAQSHLASCVRCRRDADAARVAREQFLRDLLPRTVGAVRAARQRRRWRLAAWFGGPALLAAAAAIAIVWTPPPRAVADGDLRIKGGPAFEVYAERGGRVIPVRDGTELAAGDRIRFAVVAGELEYLIVASVDGVGKVSVYHPFDGDHSAPIRRGARVELPGSVVLDDAPGPERIYALFSPRPLAAREVHARLAPIAAGGADAIRAATAVDVAGIAAQATVVVEKVDR
jgi:hypothetical protein